MSFNSNNYERPKLTEAKIIKKLLNTQVIEIPTEQKIFNNIMTFLFNNYQIIIICLIILIALYWRYEDTKKRKQIRYKNDNYDFFN